MKYLLRLPCYCTGVSIMVGGDGKKIYITKCRIQNEK